VKREFIDSDTEARKYVGYDVFTDSNSKIETKSEDAILINEFIGYTVHDIVSGSEYQVIDFYDSSENPILVLDNKGAELLLPRNADYILEIDHVGNIMNVEFPEGLTE
jgi:ribosomal 30S subunit maturation factor RimM